MSIDTTVKFTRTQINKMDRLKDLASRNNWHIAREGTKVVAYELGTDLFETFDFDLVNELMERGELLFFASADGDYYIAPGVGD